MTLPENIRTQFSGITWFYGAWMFVRIRNTRILRGNSAK